MDRREQINLPSIMIRHIARIANTTRDHVIVYGFLLARVLEHFRVELQKKDGVQVIDEIGSSTLMGWGFSLPKGEHSTAEQGPRTTFPPVFGTSFGESSIEALIQDQTRLKTELTDFKGAMAEEKELNAKRHEDLLAILAALTAKLSPPPS